MSISFDPSKSRWLSWRSPGRAICARGAASRKISLIAKCWVGPLKPRLALCCSQGGDSCASVGSSRVVCGRDRRNLGEVLLSRETVISYDAFRHCNVSLGRPVGYPLREQCKRPASLTGRWLKIAQLFVFPHCTKLFPTTPSRLHTSHKPLATSLQPLTLKLFAMPRNALLLGLLGTPSQDYHDYRGLVAMPDLFFFFFFFHYSHAAFNLLRGYIRL